LQAFFSSIFKTNILKKKRLIIVSNRLPLKVSIANGAVAFSKSEGGLATGLDSLYSDYEKHWVGWPGMYPDNDEQKELIQKELHALHITPVFLTSEQIQLFYEGYSNSTIWPLFHYFFAYTHYNPKYWDAYQAVNRIFLEHTILIASEDDIIWIQDYQLMLLPGLLRKEIPTARIGFFLHIPFPSYELFRILPEREFLLKGLLGADLIGFHTIDYMRHFISSVYRILDLDCKINHIYFDKRVVNIDSYPMGINYDLFHNAIERKGIVKYINRYRRQFGNHKIILSVDRLDYSKGILHRLRAFDSFLNDYPEFRSKVSLVMIVVPSRDNVEKYQDLKIKVDETIGAINGRYSDMTWVPVYYFYRGLPFEQLSALYNYADIALVTPLRDGMNLVAKEYVASRQNGTGVLILSEMAGAIVELIESLKVNPNNIEEIKIAIYNALIMPVEEQRERIEKMQKVIKKQNINKWATDFLGELELAGNKQDELMKKIITSDKISQLKTNFHNAQNRLLLFDYDGTLAPFANDPLKATPNEALNKLLHKLMLVPNTSLVIISGRDYTTLEQWFPEKAIKLYAEHGAFFRENDLWIKNFTSDELWKDEILLLFQKIIDKTPGSFIEVKNSALVWHYRKTDSWLAELREKQLIESLVYPCSKLNLQIMRGSKIVEVKVPNVNKGICAQQMLKLKNWDFILSIGDDTTDEDMFKVLPEEAITIKVGRASENARYSLSSYKEVLKMLNEFIT